MGGLNDIGTYLVELDAGFYQNVFTLDDDALGILDEDFLDGSTTFNDVTQYVVSVSIKRGRSSQDAQFGAGTCSIVIDDLLGQDKFSVANSASPYWNVDRGRLGFEPRRAVRISRNGEYIFVGLIIHYNTQFSIDNHNMINIECVDAFLNLTTTSINTIAAPPAEKSGARVDRILGLTEVGFPTVPAPVIATGVANLSSVAINTQTPLAYFNSLIQDAEQGRMYIDRDGVFIWESRTPNSTEDSPTIIFGDDLLNAAQIPYETLEVIYE
jgi:hypothetical protein